MKKNDIHTGICVDYTHEGLGIVKAEDFTFFIKNVLINEKIEFVITKLNKHFGYGKCLNIISPSVERVKPFCQYYGKCGGCQIQHMSYQEQLRFKTALVSNNIAKIGGINIEIQPTLASVNTCSYRNKAQFPVHINDGNVNIGFYRIHSNDIIDMNHCLIQSELINSIMMSTKKLLQDGNYANDFRHLLIKHAFYTNEVMIVFVTRKHKVIGINKLVRELVELHPEIKSVIQNVNKRNDNVILADEEYLLYGKETITDCLDDLKFIIASRSFYQVNPEQTKILYETALKFADITHNDIVIDLYCGVGTISLFLAKQAKKVIGIEIVDAAIENAKENARLNNIDNVEFICSDASSYAQYLVKQKLQVDVVVVDPPRKGCDELTLNSICMMNPRKIVYVSCNPATLARDLKKLETKGYKTTRVQPCDMFPSSFHVESIALLCRR